jgi:hypothetical protein
LTLIFANLTSYGSICVSYGGVPGRYQTPSPEVRHGIASAGSISARRLLGVRDLCQ